MQFYVPLSMEQYFSPFHLHPIWHSPLPCGLRKNSDNLAYTVMPYLKSRWGCNKLNVINYKYQILLNMLIDIILLVASYVKRHFHLYAYTAPELVGKRWY